MTPFEQAFSEVTELVRLFKENEKHYLSPKYQEAQVRTDFIDKFFAAPGWDVRHKYQTNPRESCTERTRLERKCDYLDNEIDKLVYQLYGPTEEEFRIVEGGV